MTLAGPLLDGSAALVTGGASGLGLATARHLAELGIRVVIADLPSSAGQEIAESLSERVSFVPADVTDATQVAAAVDAATTIAPLRAVVHTAGRGGSLRLVAKDGSPGDAELFAAIVQTNLVGSYLVASIAASRMSTNTAVDGQRGAIILTSSVAAFEGQVGQAGYAASKAGVVGMTLCAARDLAHLGIRLNTIAPGLMDTPMLAKLPDAARSSLAGSVPNPARLGRPEEFASLALHILTNGYLNGETFRLDGAIRMAPR